MSSSRKLSFLHRYKAEQRSLNFKVALRGLVHTYQDIFIKKGGLFSLRFRKKYTSTRSFFESFSPVYTKTLKRKSDNIPY